MHNFARQNLQNRSFRGRNLEGADFRNADIRGCNFTKAKLVGANFSGAQAGLSQRQKLVLALWISIVVISVTDPISRLVVNAITQSPLDPKAAYILVLLAFLSIAGITSAISARWRNAQLGEITLMVTGVLCGALIGFAIAFFYPTMLRDYVPRKALYSSDPGLEQLAAIAKVLEAHRVTLAQQSAIAGGILLLLLSRFRRRSEFKIAIALAGTIVSYGATFLMGTIASTFLSVQEFGVGILFILVTLIYLGLTTTSLFRAIDECRSTIGTSFKGANLTEAQFAGASLHNTDFSKAIGDFPSDLG